MSNFEVGQEVVCVDDSPGPKSQSPGPGFLWRKWDAPIVRGQHYIVRWNGMIWGATPVVMLVGVREGDPEDGGLAACRFRPVKREEIELFRQMCASPKPLVLVK